VVKGKRRISKKEFVDGVTAVLSKHFSKMSKDEQNSRLTALERRVATMSRAARPTMRGSVETPQIRLAARTRHEESQ